MKLVWRPEALNDRNTILSYIADRNLAAAERLAQDVADCTARLLVTPSMYRPGRVPSTREAVIRPNYILVYRVTADAVEIVNFIHSRQRYP